MLGPPPVPSSRLHARLVAVPGPLDPVVERQFVRTMDDQEPLCTRLAMRGERFVLSQVPAHRRLRLREGRFADEEIRVAREHDESRRRPRVTRVGENPFSVTDTEAECMQVVVEHPRRPPDQAAGLGAVRIVPGGRAPNDDELHVPHLLRNQRGALGEGEDPPPRWAAAQRETTQPLPVASNASLLHSGCTANAWPPSEMFCVSFHAHLSPFSLVCASFQPSCTDAKLSGSVTASAYSWPVTIDHPSNTPLPNASLVAFTLCMPHPLVPSPGQFVFSHGMNAYWRRYGLPRPSTLEVCVWYPQ